MFQRLESEINLKSQETNQSFCNEGKLDDQGKQSSFCKQIYKNLQSFCNCFHSAGSFLKTSLSSQGKKQFKIPNQDESVKGKKTLVLDLDETLVHSSHTNNHSDFSLSVKIHNQQTTIYVNKRPFVEEFLLIMSEYFELIVFTASMQEYAQPTIEAIDKYNKIKYKLYRENCTFWNGILVKDMTTLNRDIRNIILIDNSVQSAKFQPENCILIKSFFGSHKDTELETYIPFLQCLSTMPDIRPIQEYQKRFYLNIPFYVTNRDTNERISVNPREYVANWKEKKLKGQLLGFRTGVESLAETPMTQETDILLNRGDAQSPSRFKIEDENTKQFQQNLLNIQQNELFIKNLNDSGQQSHQQQDDEICSEFPENFQKQNNIFKNLKISAVRGKISNFNINSPLALKQVIQYDNDEDEEIIID